MPPPTTTIEQTPFTPTYYASQTQYYQDVWASQFVINAYANNAFNANNVFTTNQFGTDPYKTALNQQQEKHKMPCECPACRRDNILNGTLTTEKCCDCQTLLTPAFKFIILGDKNLICEVCVSANYSKCNSCGKLHQKGDTKKVKLSDGTESCVCARCFTQYFKECFNCHNHFDRHDVMAYGSNTYCKPCFQKCFQTCTHCNSIQPMGKMTKKIRVSYLVCDTCYSQYGPILEYSHKPYVMVNGKQTMPLHGKPPHFLGVELETEVPSGIKEDRGPVADQVIQLLGDFAIAKEDGSLRNGFEICTQPASLEEHYKRWTPFFEHLPQNLVSFKSKEDRCGLHIHCSRKPLSLLTIAKIVVFVNNSANQPNIEIIAGRKGNNYAIYAPKRYGTVHEERTRNNRYEAVNLVNRDTIEFRIFKGTLSKPHLFKALEFCDAVIQFCMSYHNGIIHCREWKNFMDYVGLRSRDYQHLYAFLCAKFQKKETKLTKKFGFSINVNDNDGQL